MGVHDAMPCIKSWDGIYISEAVTSDKQLARGYVDPLLLKG